MTYKNPNHLTGQSQAAENFDSEYRDAKSDMNAEGPGNNATARFWGMDEPTFSMLLHLSSFMSMVVPLAGVVLPIVMWATNKNDSAIIDAHGKNVFNWFISFLIYTVILVPLCFVIIGIPLLFALVICSIVFTIMAAVKANHGTVWSYPMSIRFFK
jgi:uncharacterized Tic20 family protein